MVGIGKRQVDDMDDLNDIKVGLHVQNGGKHVQCKQSHPTSILFFFSR